MLTIRHLTGPLAGTDQRIDAGKDRVVFGRSLDCDVVFPPDLTIIGRRHFALVRKPSGHWTFDLFGEFVAVNGVAADPGAAVPPGAKIELGQRGGPSFEVRIEAGAPTDNLPLTARQEQDEGPRKLAACASSTATMARRAALVGVALAVLAAGGSYLVYLFSASTAAQFNSAVTALGAAQAKLASDSISTDVRQRLSRSAFLALKKDANGNTRGVGTAWPVGPNLLATNAHVAEIRDQLGSGEAMEVRSPGANGKTYRVVEHRLHPGFRAFSAYVNQDAVMVPSYRGFQRLTVNQLGSYDVAILRVEEELPKDAILELASDEELRKLSPGDPLALAGFPMENIIGSPVQALSPTPEVQVGNVTAFTDFFMLPTEFEQSRLIHHNLPTAGGSSGSPLVNAAGRVVGLLNAGNMFFINMNSQNLRVPSAAMINYAQRVDMLRPLISGDPEKELEKDRAYWAQQIANFKRGIDVLVPEILSKAKPTKDAVPKLLGEDKHTLTTDNRFKDPRDGATKRTRNYRITLQPGERYLFIAYAQDMAPLELHHLIGGKIVNSDTGDWFPALAFPGKNRSSIRDETQSELVVLGPDRDVSFTLRRYVWEIPGSPRERGRQPERGRDREPETGGEREPPAGGRGPRGAPGNQQIPPS